MVTRHAANGDVEFASPTARSVLAAPASEILGDGPSRRVHVADRPAYLKALSDAFNSRRRSPPSSDCAVSTATMAVRESASSTSRWAAVRRWMKPARQAPSSRSPATFRRKAGKTSSGPRGDRRAGQSGQEPLPRPYESRVADAAQRDHRILRRSSIGAPLRPSRRSAAANMPG